MKVGGVPLIFIYIAIAIAVASTISIAALSGASLNGHFTDPYTQYNASCGETLLTSTTLTGDVGPCLNNGLTMGADNIYLDCNGHAIIGSFVGGGGTPSLPGDPEGSAAAYNGIQISYRTNVTVRNCNITGFQYGVYSVGGLTTNLTNNTISNGEKGGYFLGRPEYQYEVLVGNTFLNNTIAIQLASDDDYMTIENNTIINSTSVGLLMDDPFAEYTTIRNNTLSNPGAIDIQLSNFPTTNNFYDNTLSSIPTTISFNQQYGGFNISGVSSPNADTGNKMNVSRYVEVTNTTPNSWIYLNISYSDSDLTGLHEGGLAIHRYNGTAWDEVSGSGVDTAGNAVYGNLTEFSQFAPMTNALTTVSCGQTITADTVMANDLGTCTGTGLVIGANNIFLDCNGHTITGNYAVLPPSLPGEPGSSISFQYGIHLNTKQNITVKNCIITKFASGILLEGSSYNNITNNTATEGQIGITISGLGASNNSVTGNSVNNNEYGIRLTNNEDGTTIDSNNITNSDTAGLRLDGGSDYNVVRDNTFSNPGVSDIQIASSVGNEFYDNTLVPYSTTINFTYSGNLNVYGVSSPNPDTGSKANVSKYVEITNSTPAWVYLNISYEGADISAIREDTLLMHRHNGTGWEQVTGTNGVDTQSKIVYANLTGFSQFAPMASVNSLPTQGNPIVSSPSNFNYTNETITCFNQSTSDSDGDRVVNVFSWQRNGQNFEILNMPFEGGTNSTYTRDYLGLAYGFNYTGAPTWSNTSGIGNTGAYNFSNTDRIVFHTDQNHFDKTYMLWVKFDDLNLANSEGIFSADGKLVFAYAGGDFLHAGQLCAVGPGYTFTCDLAAVSAGTWYHMAYVMYPNGTGILYTNGALVPDLPHTSITDINPENYSIGGLLDSSYPFNGIIDDLRIYNESLSSSQIYQIYQEGKNSYDSNTSIVSQETRAGDNWTCSITPNDGLADGTAKSSGLQIEPMTCGTLNQDTTLENDIQTSGHCFTVGSSGITLDCGGYTISSDGTGRGIYATGKTGFTVRNCDVYNFQYGIYLYSGANDSYIMNNTVRSSADHGIYIRTSSTNNTVFENTVLSNGDDGIRIVEASHLSNVTNNTINGTSDRALYIEDSNNITADDNTITNNGVGIDLRTSLYSGLSYNDFSGNQGTNIYTTYSNDTIIQWNTMDGGTGDGITLTYSYNNDVSNNNLNNISYTGLYIFDSGSNLIQGNTVRNNTGTTAISVLGSHNRVLNNQVFDSTSTGIHIQNWSSGFYILTTNNTVLNNNITNAPSVYPSGNVYGIYLEDTDSNNISQNTIDNSGIYNFYIDNSDSNNISHNTISNCDYGIYSTSSLSNNISHNTINPCGEYGIYFTSSDSNTLLNNTASSTNKSGIFLLLSDYNNLSYSTTSSNPYAGVQLNYSDHNTIEHGTSNYNWFGITLTGSSYNNLTNNTASSNYISGINLFSSPNANLINNTVSSNPTYGISIVETNDTHAQGNTVTGSGKEGFFISPYSSQNTLTNNTITGNSQNGVLVDFFSTFNNVSYNTITGNSYWGVHLDFFSTNNTVSYNGLGLNSLGPYNETDYSTGNTITGNTG